MRKHFLQSLKRKNEGKIQIKNNSTILGFRSIIMDSGFNNINNDFERVDWLKCYWVKLNRYKKILSKSFYWHSSVG